MGDLFLNALKFVFGVLLLPIVIATLLALKKQFIHYPGVYGYFFRDGVISFILIYFFLNRFWGIYEFGQKITRGVFSMIAPANKIVSYIIPFYPALLILLLLITKLFFRTSNYDHYFLFFIGFTLIMHVLLTAQHLQEQETTPLKPNYFVGITSIIICNIMIVILLLDLVVGKFTFPLFFNDVFAAAQGYYVAYFGKVISFAK